MVTHFLLGRVDVLVLVSGFVTLSICMLVGGVMLGLTTLVGVGVLGLVLV